MIFFLSPIWFCLYVRIVAICPPKPLSTSPSLNESAGTSTSIGLDPGFAVSVSYSRWIPLPPLGCYDLIFQVLVQQAKLDYNGHQVPFSARAETFPVMINATGPDPTGLLERRYLIYGLFVALSKFALESMFCKAEVTLYKSGNLVAAFVIDQTGPTTGGLSTPSQNMSGNSIPLQSPNTALQLTEVKESSTDGQAGHVETGTSLESDNINISISWDGRPIPIASLFILIASTITSMAKLAELQLRDEILFHSGLTIDKILLTPHGPLALYLSYMSAIEAMGLIAKAAVKRAQQVRVLTTFQGEFLLDGLDVVSVLVF